MAKLVVVRMLADMPSRKLRVGDLAELPPALARIFVKRKQAAEVGVEASVKEPKAEDIVFPMPTVEEVVAAGYKPEYLETVRKDREDFIRRFNEDTEFRKAALEHAEQRAAEKLADDATPEEALASIAESAAVCEQLGDVIHARAVQGSDPEPAPATVPDKQSTPSAPVVPDPEPATAEAKPEPAARAPGAPEPTKAPKRRKR